MALAIVRHHWASGMQSSYTDAMQTFVSFSLTVLALLLAVPVTVLLLEVAAAIALPKRGLPSSRASRRPLAVLVPAHNESAGLLPTIADIRAQLRAEDRLLVVADNCVDDTAAIAAAAGAEVIERNDPSRIGKGYALDWGLRHLSSDPPEIVIIVDADCRLSGETITSLATTCIETGRPTQALDLMTAPERSSPNHQVAEFAWRVKNWVRPLGLSNLHLPCQLMGTGMAFPWELIRSAKLASGQIVEDLRLGLDLASVGTPPIFCPAAVVTSRFPQSAEGTGSQRQRWEHGHIQTIVTSVPRYIGAAIARRDLGLFVLTLDLAVPPLALLGLLVSALLAVTGFAAVFGVSSTGFLVSLASFLALALSIFLCWLTYGRDILPFASFLSLGTYVLGKAGLYRRLLLRGFVTQWIRTDREKPKPPSDVHRH